MTKAMESIAANPDVQVAAQDQGGIRGLRHSIRQALGIQKDHHVTMHVIKKAKNSDG